MEKPIIVLTGATASGKTALSFSLAKEFNGEIICADSMTVYRGLDIGTDKPTLVQRSKFKVQKSDGGYLINGVRHHMLDILDPNEEFNAAIFKEKAAKVVQDIQERGKIPILVGGSLLYIDTFVYDFTLSAVKPDSKLRKELEKKTNDELFSDLVALDPDAEWTVDRNNRRRLIRALEVCLKSGRPFTAQKTKKSMPENVLYLAVAKNRDALYADINKRVDEMMKLGFLEETKKLNKKYHNAPALEATGYRQLIQYLNGEITLPEAVEKTKQFHRNFAKRQLTWLRHNSDVIWVENKNEAETAINSFLTRNSKIETQN